MAGLTPMTALGTAQPQSPNGTAVNASMMLGLPGLGNNLQDDMKDKMDAMRKGKILLGTDGNPTAYGSPLLGASQSLFGPPAGK
jgi:hypothetical protein